MTKKNATKVAARARQERFGGKYAHHHHQAGGGGSDDVARCGGCHEPIGAERDKCPHCGWILLNLSAFEALERDDLPERQRYAIELELAAVAQTGPRRADESESSYRDRVVKTMDRLIRERHPEAKADAEDHCSRCGEPAPNFDNQVTLFAGSDDDDDGKTLGEWMLCDGCAVELQHVFLGARAGSTCAHCGAREESGWARVMAGAPSVDSDGFIDTDMGESSDDPICPKCIPLLRAHVSPPAFIAASEKYKVELSEAARWEHTPHTHAPDGSIVPLNAPPPNTHLFSRRYQDDDISSEPTVLTDLADPIVFASRFQRGLCPYCEAVLGAPRRSAYPADILELPELGEALACNACPRLFNPIPIDGGRHEGLFEWNQECVYIHTIEGEGPPPPGLDVMPVPSSADEQRKRRNRLKAERRKKRR